MVRVTMLVYGGVEHDGRVRRAAATLVDAGYAVTIACLAGMDHAVGAHGAGFPERLLEGAHVVAVPAAAQGVRLPGSGRPQGGGRLGVALRPVSQAAWLFGYGRALRAWRAGLVARLEPADLWYGHDPFGLWAAAALQHQHGGRLLYDSHELFMESGTAAALPPPARWALARVERRLARRADDVITVNPAIAEELGRRYGIAPSVVMNVPRGWRPASRDRLRETLPVGDSLVVMYHGAVSPGRGIEQLIDASRELPPGIATVVLGDGALSERVAALAREPRSRGRLFTHPAVPIEELPDWVGSADVGVIAFQSTAMNNVLGSPNKLFDYLMAGVPVVVSDFPEMRRLVGSVDGGLTCDPADPLSIATGIRQLLEVPSEVRLARRARLAAVSSVRYAWSAQAEVLLAAVRRAVGP